MKCQFLGDSKDSLKWDYLHFLIENLGYSHLKTAWMMTPDDNSGQGKTEHTEYPARSEILGLCEALRTKRDYSLISFLPHMCSAQYGVHFHAGEGYFLHSHREQYFHTLTIGQRELLFLDPDNGFRPDKSFNAAHVGYDEIAGLLERNPSALITVFHHFRRIKFQDDLAQIRKRLGGVPASAIYWDGKVMFVSVSTCSATIRNVEEINRKYATAVLNRPNGVKLISCP